MSKLTFFAAFVASGMSAVTVFGYSTNVWTGAVNDWNWNEAGNYRDGLPSAGDIVQIPEATTVKLNASTDADSLGVVNGLKQIWPTAADAVLEVTVTDGDEKSISIPFTSFPFVNTDKNGELRKLGGGILNLTSLNSCNGTAIQDYWTHLHVVEGSLKMAKGISGQAQIAKVTIDAGAFFFPYSVASGVTPDTNNKCGLYWQALSGEGTVTNDYPTSATVYYLRPAGSEPCEFAGEISKQFRIYTAGGNWTLTGERSMTAREIPVITKNFGYGPNHWQGILGVKKIGNPDEASSIGPHPYMVNFRGDGACFRYVGEGETTTKYITWQNQAGSSIYWNFFDGGPFGGLDLAGTIQAYQTGGKTMARTFERIMLTGSNATECVISGNVLTQTMPEGQEGGQPFFGKQGSGTWRFADAANNATARQFGTPFVVEGGTLAFDSLAEIGEPCSLGLGDKLFEPFSGTASGVPVDWFFALGRTNENHAVPAIEFSGKGRTVGAGLVCSTRTVELRGSGRISNASTNTVRFAGVRSAAGGVESIKYLCLGGSRDAEDMVCDIADGTGDTARTGVRKDGTGTWTLGGDLTFTGPIEVESGMLKVRNTSRFTWFKFNICEVMENCARYRGTSAKTTGYTVQLGEVGLFDKDGKDIVKNCYPVTSVNSNYYEVAAGQIAFDTLDFKTHPYNTTGTTGWTDRNFDKLFDGNLGGSGYSRGQARNSGIRRDVPSSWNGLVFRLPETVKETVASWDVGEIGGYTYGDSNRLVTACQLLASPDGVHWTNVTGTDDGVRDLELIKSGAHWVSDGKNVTTTHTGWAMPGGRTTPFSVTPKTVKVAKGATLKAEGDDPVTISGIIASTNGVGTIDGFAFAESGTIDIPEVSRIGKGISIEADFRNCELPDASEWTLKLNGTVKPNASVAITPTGIKVAGTGLMVIFR